MLCFRAFMVFKSNLKRNLHAVEFHYNYKNFDRWESKSEQESTLKLFGPSFQLYVMLFLLWYECNCMAYSSMPTSRVENSAQISSRQLKFVRGWKGLPESNATAYQAKAKITSQKVL
jgi:hypothetical protein